MPTLEAIEYGFDRDLSGRIRQRENNQYKKLTVGVDELRFVAKLNAGDADVDAVLDYNMTDGDIDPTGDQDATADRGKYKVHLLGADMTANMSAVVRTIHCTVRYTAPGKTPRIVATYNLPIVLA